LIMTSIILNALFLAIIGAYVGRIYQQVKRRPFTIIADRLGYDTPPGSAPQPDDDVGEAAHPGRQPGSEPPDGSIEPSD